MYCQTFVSSYHFGILIGNFPAPRADGSCLFLSIRHLMLGWATAQLAEIDLLSKALLMSRTNISSNLPRSSICQSKSLASSTTNHLPTELSKIYGQKGKSQEPTAYQALKINMPFNLFHIYSILY